MRSSIVGNPEYGKAVFMYYFEDGEEIDIDFEREFVGDGVQAIMQAKSYRELGMNEYNELQIEVTYEIVEMTRTR
jgi:hypothetical protein